MSITKSKHELTEEYLSKAADLKEELSIQIRELEKACAEKKLKLTQEHTAKLHKLEAEYEPKIAQAPGPDMPFGASTFGNPDLVGDY